MDLIPEGSEFQAEGPATEALLASLMVCNCLEHVYSRIRNWTSVTKRKYASVSVPKYWEKLADASADRISLLGAIWRRHHSVEQKY